jgi:hypothetical protein
MSKKKRNEAKAASAATEAAFANLSASQSAAARSGYVHQGVTPMVSSGSDVLPSNASMSSSSAGPLASHMQIQDVGVEPVQQHQTAAQLERGHTVTEEQMAQMRWTEFQQSLARQQQLQQQIFQRQQHSQAPHLSTQLPFMYVSNGPPHVSPTQEQLRACWSAHHSSGLRRSASDDSARGLTSGNPWSPNSHVSGSGGSISNGTAMDTSEGYAGQMGRANTSMGFIPKMEAAAMQQVQPQTQTHMQDSCQRQLSQAHTQRRMSDYAHSAASGTPAGSQQSNLPVYFHQLQGELQRQEQLNAALMQQLTQQQQQHRQQQQQQSITSHQQQQQQFSAQSAASVQSHVASEHPVPYGKLDDSFGQKSSQWHSGAPLLRSYGSDGASPQPPYRGSSSAAVSFQQPQPYLKHDSADASMPFMAEMLLQDDARSQMAHQLPFQPQQQQPRQFSDSSDVRDGQN